MTKKKRNKKRKFKSPETESKSIGNLRRGDKPGTVEQAKLDIIERRYDKKKLQEMNIIEFAEDPDYLNLSFKERPVQRVILKAVYSLPLNEEELKIFKILTKGKGRYREGSQKHELIACLGARSGKSFLVSVCCLFEATRGEYQKYVTKGEYAYICVIATREKQAIAIIQTNCLRMLQNSPNLKGLIKKTTELEITLRNHIKIISGPANSTALRGLAICVLCLDECAFYRIIGPKADETIFNSLRPRQAQFPDNKLFLVSTAGSKQGLFFRYFDEGFKIEDRLTIQGKTSFVNPEIPQKFLDKERSRDIDNFLREFEGEFSEKLEAFFGFELLQKPFVLVGDLPYRAGYNYHLALDQSGLSGRDRFALAISHKEGDIAIVDVVRSWQTKDLDVILNEIESLAKAYHLSVASIDKYSKGYVEASFKKIKLLVKIRPSLSVVFVVLKSKMIQDRLKLPDRPDLKAGLKNTIAIYNKSNQLTIIHERGPDGHADESDAVAGAVYESIGKEEEKLGGILHYDSPGSFWVERNPKSKPEPFNWPHKVTPEEEAKEKEEETFNWY
ncbi:hypothetical protein ES705_28643 [subsurface metagenome]